VEDRESRMEDGDLLFSIFHPQLTFQLWRGR
jgi:hypothetical protein